MSESRPENNVRTANCSARVRLFGSGQSRENISTQNFDGCTIASGSSIMLAAGVAMYFWKMQVDQCCQLNVKITILPLLCTAKFKEKFSKLAIL